MDERVARRLAFDPSTPEDVRADARSTYSRYLLEEIDAGRGREAAADFELWAARNEVSPLHPGVVADAARDLCRAFDRLGPAAATSGTLLRFCAPEDWIGSRYDQQSLDLHRPVCTWGFFVAPSGYVPLEMTVRQSDTLYHIRTALARCKWVASQIGEWARFDAPRLDPTLIQFRQHVEDVLRSEWLYPLKLERAAPGTNSTQRAEAWLLNPYEGMPLYEANIIAPPGGTPPRVKRDRHLALGRATEAERAKAVPGSCPGGVPRGAGPHRAAGTKPGLCGSDRSTDLDIFARYC